MRKIFIILLTAAMSLPVFSQTHDDLGLWLTAGVEKKLTKKWAVEVEAEYRMRDKIRQTDRFSIGVATSYKLTKWLKADAGYDYLHTRKEGGLNESGSYYYSSYWQPRHRVHVSFTETLKAGRMKFSFRERWVYTYTPAFDRHRMDVRQKSDGYGEVSTKEVGKKGENVLRLKVGAEYNIPKCKFTPFASVEGYLSCGQETCFGNALKARYAGGVEYDITKHHSVKLYYMYQDKKEIATDDEEMDSHIIGAGYSFSF